MTVASDGLSGYARIAPVLGLYGKGFAVREWKRDGATWQHRVKVV